jgi:signal transduction histidine kinase
MHERGGIVGRRKSGELFPAEASISHIELNGRRVYTDVVRDVTERHRLEQERARLLEAEQSARAIAEAATQARDIVLAVVSHDLRQPLSTIAMCASALARPDEISPETRQELADSIDKSAQWMHRMLRDLLDASNIEAGRLSLEARNEHPADLIARARSLLQPIADEVGLTLYVQVEPGLPPVSVDAQRITQVLANLGYNACKFTASGGSVTLRVLRVADGVRFEMQDTGRGIPESDLPHVFDRFWQRRGAAKRGTGLGLAIARGIVEAHEGRVEVASTLGKGSVFAFVLPA